MFKGLKILKYTEWFALGCLALITLFGCKDEPVEPTPIAKCDFATLVYFSGSNNLYDEMCTNIDNMCEGISYGTLGANRVLFFMHPSSSSGLMPYIGEITSSGEEVLYTYSSEINSLDPSIMKEIIADLKSLAPADGYGLILSSHASGWMFSDVGIRSSENRALDSYEGVLSPTGIPVEDDYYDYPATKSFGNSTYQSVYYEMDIPVLKGALEDNGFEYILFDCCYMGNIESIYELKDKANYIIGSATEIISTGFPYDRCLQYLNGENYDLDLACENYYEYYNSLSGTKKSATIALYDCSQLSSLASCTQKIVSENSDKIDALDVDDLQCFDRYTYSFIYDMDDYISNIATTEQYSEFTEALSKVVISKYNTSYFLYYAINKFCGVSASVPGKINYGLADNYYETLDWYKDVYQ